MKSPLAAASCAKPDDWATARPCRPASLTARPPPSTLTSARHSPVRATRPQGARPQAPAPPLPAPPQAVLHAARAQHHPRRPLAAPPRQACWPDIRESGSRLAAQTARPFPSHDVERANAPKRRFDHVSSTRSILRSSAPSTPNRQPHATPKATGNARGALSAALTYGIATPSSTHPVLTHAMLSGVELPNPSGETCGGSLIKAFTVPRAPRKVPILTEADAPLQPGSSGSHRRPLITAGFARAAVFRVARGRVHAWRG